MKNSLLVIRLSTLASTFVLAAANASVVDIKFNADGRFMHETEMPVGKTIELCGALKAGAAIDWSFKNSAPLNFNIHFHKGEAVSYPFQQKGASNLAQKFMPETEQDYCWMWTNRNLQPVKLSVELITAIAKVNTASAAVTASAPAAVTVGADMTAGEIRKIDKDTKKITIKHAEIKNLEMPAMTMVFQLKEPALFEKIQVGDKVKFKAEKVGSAFVVTDIAVDK